MALATRCPHCHTTFRVASDQLKLRGGIVRCGACQRIFDGSAHLVDLQPPAPAPAPAAPPPAEEAVHAADLGHPFDLPGILPEPAPSLPPSRHEHEPDSHPVSSQPMQAAAAPFAPGRPQVWRTASRSTPEDGGADKDREDAAHAGDVRPDAAAAAVAEAPPPIASLAPEQTPAADADAGAPTYAPADRIEPQLEPLYEPLQDVVAQPASVLDAVVEPAMEPEAAPAPEQEQEPEQEQRQAAPEPVPDSMPVHGYAPPNRIEPSFGMPVDEELVAQALPDDEHALEPELLEAQPEPEPAPAPAPPPLPDIPPAALPLRASAVDDTAAVATPAPPRSARAKATEARTRRSRLTPTKIEPPRLRVPHDDVDEPEFVKRSRRLERSGRTRRVLLGAGSAVLLLALLAQGVTTWRNVLAARSPALKPVLEGACALLGCRVALPAQVDNLAIETGELATLGPGTYSLHTLLRNQGNLVQAWPSIELELTDDDNKPVLRRVFTPAEYLPRGTAPDAGFAARSEQPVRLHFALRDVTPSDYHLFVFYP
ncbi:DUF3426 domain-containing protein [Massilia sp. TN1-12]|uniref:DUF3426 domain-containing protein n=1 Tax=Massilia paldalensis TaxID=3377675 RepID=UPI00384DC061